MGRRQEPRGPARKAETDTAEDCKAEDRKAKDRKAKDRKAKDRKAKDRMTKPRTAKAGFAEVVLVCGKCAKRQGVDRKRLGRALKRAAGRAGSETALPSKARGKARKVKVVETGCLGPCPKRMLTVATAASLARGRVVLLDPALDTVSRESLSLEPLGLAAHTLSVPATPDADG